MRMLHCCGFVFLLFLVFNGVVCFERVCYILATKPHVPIEPQRMKWNLCTHLIISFATISNATINSDSDLTDYIVKVKKANSTQVKFLFSIGNGFDFAKNQTQINRFIDSVVEFMEKYQLDGVDIDWEYPYQTGDKQNFSKLLRLLRARFKHELAASNKTYILTTALTPIMFIVEGSYEVRSIAESVDFVNLMTYDFHTPKTIPYTNYNSPLYPNKLDMLYFKYFNVHFAIHYMHSLGLSRKKMMVGIPFYGYLYYLSNAQYHGVYSLYNGTQVDIGYSEVCSKFLPLPQTIRVFDRDSKVPYAYNQRRWISYDDMESVTLKAQWIADNSLGGSMTFALNYDDYDARCGNFTFPLQTILYDILGN